MNSNEKTARDLINLVKEADDTLKGGVGDDIDEGDLNEEQMDMGEKVEMEHTDDPSIAREIARDHLSEQLLDGTVKEDQDYYTLLKEIDDHEDCDDGFWRKNLDYGEKTAQIRGSGIRECPFGLPVPNACMSAGSAVSRMAEIGETGGTAKANRLIFAYHRENKECPFANKILKNNSKVDCNYGGNSEGKKSMLFTGSPLYPQTFHGMGLDGLYGIPLGFYADNNESRNLFYGLFSLIGSASPEQLIKLADEYDVAGDEDRATIVDNIIDKLGKMKEFNEDIFIKIERYLNDGAE